MGARRYRNAGAAVIWCAVRGELTCSVGVDLRAAVGHKALRVVANSCADDFEERMEDG